MRSARLSLAFETGAISLPVDGPLLVLRSHADDDFTALPKERLTLVQGFRPDHDALAARGFAVTARAEGDFAAALVCLPRARAEAQALVAEAVARVPVGAPVVIDGQKTEGVDTMLRDCRARVAVGEALSKAHGKIFSFDAPGPEVFADWAARPNTLPDGFQTLPGVFSADGVDPASELLAEALPESLPRRIADLGAGWGYLSRAILARTGVEELHLIEAEAAALDCARRNITDPRAQFHWADATRLRLAGPVDAVVMNPPFHTGRSADPALGAAFITAAAGYLGPAGTLWMVANRHLPYDAPLAAAFRDIEEIGSNRSFRLIRAHRPFAKPRGAR